MNHQRLICYQLAMSIAKDMPGLIGRWPRGYYYLSDQLKRAITSIVLNIAEGNGRMSQAERKRFFTISMASSSEVSSILEIAYAYKLIYCSPLRKLFD
jgi:four helix bundle protein